MIEFSYNYSYHSRICITPFEALYGRKCRSLIGWFEVAEVALIGLNLVHEAIKNVRLIRVRLKTTQSRQVYVDVKRRDLKLYVHDWVYFIISPRRV